MSAFFLALGALAVFLFGYVFGYAAGRSSGKVAAIEQAHGIDLSGQDGDAE